MNSKVKFSILNIIHMIQYVKIKKLFISSTFTPIRRKEISILIN